MFPEQTLLFVSVLLMRLHLELVHPASTRIPAVVVQAIGTRCRPGAASSAVDASPVNLWRTLLPGATCPRAVGRLRFVLLQVSIRIHVR
jgi:hypothetical protein